MKLTIPRKPLAQALDAVVRIVERRNTIPIMSNVLIVATSGGIEITATDCDMTATARVEADVATPGRLTVAAGRLHDIVKKLDEKATVSLDASDTALAVKAGRAKFNLSTLPAADFPDLGAGEMTARFFLPAKTLARGLQKSAFAASTEETRYYLNGVFMHIFTSGGDTALRFVATDSYRLARVECAMPEGAADLSPVIIPRKAVTELMKLASSHDGDAEIEASATKLRFTIGATTLLTKTIDGNFPDYARVIPTQNDKIAKVDRDAFKSAAERVSTISSERGRAVKLEFADGALKLSVSNPNLGSASEEIESDYQSGPLEIGFNAGYLTEILSQFDGDLVEVKLNDSGSPTLITSPHDADLLTVIMPMRV
jgi:DNA polymerase-3 subunit beta